MASRTRSIRVKPWIRISTTCPRRKRRTSRRCAIHWTWHWSISTKIGSFLKAGGVFTDDVIDAYITLKMQEVTRLRMTTHPVEFDMYYSL